MSLRSDGPFPSSTVSSKTTVPPRAGDARVGSGYLDPEWRQRMALRSPCRGVDVRRPSPRTAESILIDPHACNGGIAKRRNEAFSRLLSPRTQPSHLQTSEPDGHATVGRYSCTALTVADPSPTAAETRFSKEGAFRPATGSVDPVFPPTSYGPFKRLYP